MMDIEPVTLEGKGVQLVPLSLDHHTQLCDIGLDERLWQRTTIRLQNPDDMLRYIQTALREQAEGTALPFVLIEKKSNRVVGTSRYHHINKAHRRVEIGFTWIAVPWQRIGINTEAKYLMLQHAFERLECVRVEFKADTSNEQSCRALRRIGAKEEGVLRKYMVSSHKGARDVMLFSIIDAEWPDVKADLEKMLTR
jgi:N-acetyltransferase